MRESRNGLRPIQGYDRIHRNHFRGYLLSLVDNVVLIELLGGKVLQLELKEVDFQFDDIDRNINTYKILDCPTNRYIAKYSYYIGKEMEGFDIGNGIIIPIDDKNHFNFKLGYQVELVE